VTRRSLIAAGLLCLSCPHGANATGRFLTAAQRDRGVTGTTAGVVFSVVVDGRLVLRRVDADLKPDPTFGNGGTLRVTLLNGDGGSPWVIERSDGELIVAIESRRLLFVAVTREGTVDASFGTNGIATAASVHDAVVALASDGAIAYIGTQGHGNPSNNERWFVGKLTPDGKPDLAFGETSVMRVPGTPSSYAVGEDIALLADGGVVTLGEVRGAERLVWLNPDGTPSQAFHHGTPQATGCRSASGIAVDDDRRVIVACYDQVGRLLPDGRLDSAFGQGGRLHLGGDWFLFGDHRPLWLVSYNLWENRPADPPAFRILTLGEQGVVTRRAVRLRFGGGYAGDTESAGEPVVPMFTQNSFDLNGLVPLPDGRWLAFGTTTIDASTGHDAGLQFRRSEQEVVARLDADLSQDATFDRMTPPLRFAVRSAGQRRLRITTSAPGLIEVIARDAKGRLLGAYDDGLLYAGRRFQTVPVLTRTRATRARVTIRMRDALGRWARTTLTVRL
jgi:hypothetical protein